MSTQNPRPRDEQPLPEHGDPVPGTGHRAEEPGPVEGSHGVGEQRTASALDRPAPAPGAPGAPDQHAPTAPGDAPSAQQRVDHVSDPRLDEPVKRGTSGVLWAGLILGVIVLILLLVFILQNNVPARFLYFGWEFNLPLGVAILLAAIAGALIMAMVGSVRMFSLSHRVRKLEKERRRIKDTLTD